MITWISENTDLFLYIFVLNIMIIIVNFFIMCKIQSLFVKRRLSLKICALIGSILSISTAFINTLITIRQIGTKGSYFPSYGIIIISVAMTMMLAFAVAFLFHPLPFGFVFFIAACVGALLDMMDIVGETFGPYLYILENYTSYWIKGGARFVLILGNLIICSVFIVLCSKLKVFESLKTLIKYPKLCYCFGIIMQIARFGLLRFFNSTGYGSLLYYLIIAIGILLIGLLIRTSIGDLQKKQMELLVKQQMDYTNRLEAIQNELRAIHHDYKNIAAGLYLQAQEGDVESVKEYVSEKLLHLDRNIQLNIRQMNQLINIKQIELKSLLFTKMEMASGKNVIIDIEVLRPTNKIHMDMEDILRTVGILLDNAIEEAAITKDKKVICMLLQENEKLTILVKNTLERNVNISSIYEQGFSTKGDNRGFGLHNLRKIIYQYKNVFIETKVSQNWFIQILTIVSTK